LTELLYDSRHVVVGTPTDLSSQWEVVGRRSRIVTYTVLQVEQLLDGSSPRTSELVVRTLGGSVGDIGQIVPGEAVLRRGVRSTVFAQAISEDVFAVAGMAQGHYPLAADARGVERLIAHLADVRQVDESAAIRKLDGRTVLEAEALVAKELARVR
jgi:hypothetical protein